MFRCFCVFLLLWSAASGQPRFTLQFTGGYSIPTGDLKGEFGPTVETFRTNNPDTNTYYMKQGLNFGIYGKQALGKAANFRIAGGLIYNRFSRNVNYNVGGQFASIKMNMTVLSIAAGGEWGFLPKKSKINPFVEGAVAVNFISGGFTKQQADSTITYSLESSTRIGFHLGGGLDFPLSYRVGLTAGFKYAVANLIGKQSGIDIATTYALNDERYGRKRTISYLQFYGGVSFYFGL